MVSKLNSKLSLPPKILHRVEKLSGAGHHDVHVVRCSVQGRGNANFEVDCALPHLIGDGSEQKSSFGNRVEDIGWGRRMMELELVFDNLGR